MSTRPAGPTRREALRLAGGAALTVLAAGCRSGPRSPRTSPTAPRTGAGPGSGAPTAPTPSLATLSARLSRPLLRPGSPDYRRSARLYNPRFDGVAVPAAIARCATVGDVAACVRFAGTGGGGLRLRAGGHSYGGWSTGPNLVVDVSGLSAVTVDTAGGVARIGAGARLATVYAALAARGMAVAAGSCPTVGITGLALGGGVGVLTRAFGLTCDALRSVQIVTADGAVREVDGRRDADLFWALRGGGGGSFGAVTALTVAVRAAPRVSTFYLEWGFSDAEAVLSGWQRWVAGADRALWSTCKLLATPRRGRLRALVAGTWIGPPTALDGQLAPLLAAVGAPPVARSAATVGYGQAMLLEAGCSGRTTEQCLADAVSPTKRQPFAATSAILGSPLPPAGIAAAAERVRAGLGLPDMVEGGVSFDALGGAVAAIAPAATAFVHRRALASVQFTATWTPMTGSAGAVSPDPFDAYVRGQRSALMRWTGAAAYVNYADPAIRDYGSAYWGANYPRLRAVKKQYDPAGLFTFPQAVRA